MSDLTRPNASPMAIFSIGHSNHPLDAFLDLLRTQGIEVLVDVRSAPYSRYVPHFNPANIKASLKEAGFQYLYMGKELGGRPDSAEFYDADGHVRYDRLAESPLFLAGLDRVIKGSAQFRVAMMCSEENPTDCHRRLLITRVLAGRNIPVRHIRGDGRIETEATLAEVERSAEEAAGQLSLFDEQEIKAWRSIRPIAPKQGLSGSESR